MKSEQVEGGVWVSRGRLWGRAGSLMLDSVSNKADAISKISPDKTIWRARESAAGAASTGDPAFRAIDTKATIFSETVLTLIYLWSDFLICAQSILF